MVKRHKKKTERVNLLEMETLERIRLLEKMRMQLKQTIEEAKLMRSLLQVENLTVNGNIVYNENERLAGFSLPK